MTIKGIILLTVTAVVAGCASAKPQSSREALLRVDITTHSDVISPGEPLLATFEIRNVSERRVAVTETFGFAELYLRVQIERQTGSEVAYPPNSQYELFGSPPFICLRPGEVRYLELDLNSWYQIFGGKREVEQEVSEPGPYSFNLQAGVYRIRALYDDDYSSTRLRCERSQGTAVSPWVEFRVVED